mgnify:CR=1 FL=1
MKDIYDYIDKNAQEYIADLQSLIQQPSISAQNIGLHECANFVKNAMHKDNLPAELYDVPGGPPLVFGHLKSSQSKKTLLCYSHYDVQPPEPIEEWSHGGPWSGAIVDNIIYGRGATDNKGGLLAFNKAAKAFLEVRGEVPLNLKFFYEGEEEIGSVHLGPWVEKNKELLAADGMHCLDGSVDSFAKVPEVELGLKSVLFIELTARGGKKDIHSLNFPLVPSAPWELVHALSTIMDRNRKILIKDWYDGLYELGEEELNLIEEKNSRVDLNVLKEEFGIENFVLNREGKDAIRARTYEPTANIQGMVSGYTGPGTKTIVPSEAKVRLDFRLLPHMNPQNCIVKIKNHLIDNGFGNIEVKASESSEPPYKISVKEDISQAIIKAAEEVFGEKPVVNGVSAEGTIMKHVWIPCVLTGFANSGANLHAPDENINIDNYIKGIKYAAAIMENFSK